MIGDHVKPKHLALVALTLAACGAAPQVRVANYEDPATASNPAGAAHIHSDDTIELEADAEPIEPEHPYAKTPQERAMVHIHTPKGVCSGAIVGPKLVLTAHQCVGNEARGVFTVTDRDSLRVELASSTTTWTERRVTHIVTADCDWAQFDAALLVLDEPVPASKPIDLATTPAPGAPVQALGFGRCRGETRGFSGRTGQVVERESDAVVFDVPMCKGDVGGVVFDGNASAFGIVSHQDDPNGSARRTTTAFRLDTSVARHLMELGNAVATGSKDSTPVACR
ncbi:hypothetical protein BH09MYX1_BH09MYX1_41650 [soil metagenome]